MCGITLATFRWHKRPYIYRHTYTHRVGSIIGDILTKQIANFVGNLIAQISLHLQAHIHTLCGEHRAKHSWQGYREFWRQFDSTWDLLRVSTTCVHVHLPVTAYMNDLWHIVESHGTWDLVKVSTTCVHVHLPTSVSHSCIQVHSQTDT